MTYQFKQRCAGCSAVLALLAAVGDYPSRAAAGVIEELSGHHRAAAENNPSLDASLSFAVFRRDGTAGDVFGTGYAGFDNVFNAGNGSAGFDTSAEYLYLYQYVNDGTGDDPFGSLTLGAKELTSWGHWTLGFCDADGAIDVGNPLGPGAEDFSFAPRAVLGAPGAMIGDTLSSVPGSDDREPLSMSFGNNTLSLGLNLRDGQRLSVFGFTSDAPPVVRNFTLEECPDNLACGGYVSTIPEPATLLLFATACLGVVATSRRR